ncbi:aminotransferase [Acidovorax sp. Leaf76]|uniref:transaminase n=1 Tax=unclassified Acidovorax TaxID=2684926 RepID=UPI0006FC597B|nr:MULTISPECIES: transaminase [unclassified Acidovorax]KQO16174.1 aminotransferase [Acidovorax sp. Leaf76]KQO32246.1 aminotransferase [Acidovorax sp. Leaf84]KQS31807.1 aminotransferase [Acidovorax sp. Leaf191]
MTSTVSGVSCARIAELMRAEQSDYAATHVRSGALYAQGKGSWLYGAPSHWMRRWIGGWPVYIDGTPRPYGVRFADVDGNEYVDFCLGDTGGMCGHGHPAVVEAMARQARVGTSLMLPNGDAEWVGEELQRRFGLPYWNLTTSATDANRACIRLARMITHRPRVLIFSGAYHGNVEEAHVELREGALHMRNGLHHNFFPHQDLSAVVEFNDVAALEAALRQGDVACVLAEPAMTNYGMIAPQPGFHAELRRLTRETGTVLIIDETHTISSGPGGATRTMGLTPDMFVLGKAIAGGIPAAAFGLSQAMAERVWQVLPPVHPTVRQSAHAGMGGTLAGNALTVAVMRAVLSEVLTDGAFERMLVLSARLHQGVADAIARHRLPWHATRVGARVETMFAPDEPRNASDVKQHRHGELEALLHLYLMNRGVLITPFHNMMLCCPGTQAQDVDQHNRAFDALVRDLLA